MKKRAEKLTSDKEQKLWEDKKLGNDRKYAESVALPADIEKPMPTSIRLPASLIADLKKLAKEEGLPYQTYLKMVLTKHVKSKKVI